MTIGLTVEELVEIRRTTRLDMAKAMIASMRSLLVVVQASPTIQAQWRKDPLWAFEQTIFALEDRHVRGIRDVAKAAEDRLKGAS